MKTIICAVALFVCSARGIADEPPRVIGVPDLKDFQQIITVLRAHYADAPSLNDKVLSEAAIAGLLAKLGQGAKLLTADEAAQSDAAAVVVARQQLYAPEIAYVRVGILSSGAAKATEEALAKLNNPKLNGWILDLRFASGNDYHEAAALAGLFLEKDKPLLTMQKANGEISQSFENSQDPRFARTPVIVLVNSSTRGAPEAVAAIFQHYKRGLLIGQPTAGEGFGLADVPIGDGRILRIPTQRVLVAKGVDLWHKPVEPELRVKIEAAEEKGIVLGTAPPRKKKPIANEGGIRSEAELLSVFNGSGDSTVKPTQEMIEQTEDLVLARALDVLNAWHTFHQSSPRAAVTP